MQNRNFVKVNYLYANLPLFIGKITGKKKPISFGQILVHSTTLKINYKNDEFSYFSQFSHNEIF